LIPIPRIADPCFSSLICLRGAGIFKNYGRSGKEKINLKSISLSSIINIGSKKNIAERQSTNQRMLFKERHLGNN